MNALAPWPGSAEATTRSAGAAAADTGRHPLRAVRPVAAGKRAIRSQRSGHTGRPK